MNADLLEIFESIAIPSGANNPSQFGAVVIAECPHFHLAKDSQGSPSLLISVKEDSGKNSVPSITLEHLSIFLDVSCRITQSNGETIDGIFTVIRCTGHEYALQIYFLRAIRILFDMLPELPTKSQVTKAINTLVELFRAASLSPLKTIQGLWAELLIIDSSSDPEMLVNAWHSTPLDRYDFNAGAERLEVKSTSKSIRQHHFSLEQVVPVEGTRVWIASLFTEQVNNGVTVMQLADSVRTKITAFPHLVEHLDRIVAVTLGQNWRLAFVDAFDKQLSLSSLRYFDALTIPAPRFPLPNGVTEVRFKSDLSHCEQITPSQIVSPDSLFSALRRK